MFVCLVACLLVYSFVNSSVCLFVCLFVCLLACLFVYLLLFTCNSFKHPVRELNESMSPVEVLSEETSEIIRILSRDVIEVECMPDAVNESTKHGSDSHVLVE